MTRLFHSAGAVGAVMNPAEGARAAAEYRGVGSHVCNNGSCRGCRVLLLHAAVQSTVRAAKNLRSRVYKLSTSNLKDQHFSHPTCAGLSSL